MNYLSGYEFGLPESCSVHELANIVGEITAGEDCRIDAFVTITGKVKLGNRVHIGTGACIFGGGGVTIGDACSLSPGSKVFTASDDIRSDLLANPQAYCKAYKQAPVAIGSFSVVGANAVVLPGVTIGKEVQIGALAVVRTDIPPNQVWGGVPAHYICPRAPLDRGAIMGTEVPENIGAVNAKSL